jgi:hypothetical protein
MYLEARGSYSKLVAVKDFGGRSFIFLRDDKHLDLFELTRSLQLKRLEVSTKFDLKKDDGSAEYIFQFGEVRASEDLSKFYVSQGFHGVTELSVK